MEIIKLITVQDEGGIEIHADITRTIGSELKYLSINAVWFILTKSDDTLFSGEVLPHDGSTYFLPEQLLSEMNIKRGDTLKLAYSEDLGFIIGKKAENSLDESRPVCKT